MVDTESYPTREDMARDMVLRFVEEVPADAFDIQTGTDVGVVFFNGDVTEQAVDHFQHLLVQVHLNLPKGQDINIYLTSVGGDCYTGMALISLIHTLRREGRKVNVHVQGVAMSMGSLIAQAASWRTIESHAYFMLHEVQSFEEGSTSQMRDSHKFSERLQRTLYAMYSARTGKPIEYYEVRLDGHEWYLDATEALAEGLVDEILATADEYEVDIDKPAALPQKV